MTHRIEIAVRPGRTDARAAHIHDRIRRFLHRDVASVRTRDVYHVDADLTEAEASRFRDELTDPVLQVGAVGRLDDGPFDAAVTIAYKPGVTDPVGKSARVAVQDTLGRELPADAAVYSSVMVLFRGVDRDGARGIALDLLANPVIQTVRAESYEEWSRAEPDLAVPRVTASDRPAVAVVDLSGDDDELQRISRDGLLALTLEEMHAIRDHFRAAVADPRRVAAGFGEHPTDAELECIAQTWSEHCKHKIFNATITYHEDGAPPQRIPSLFKRYIRAATETIDRRLRATDEGSWLVSVFHDNAGVVKFDDRIHLVYKVETHNSPSALDPYGGAITGIVGVNRDPFGTGRGAELLSNVWGYCFASPTWDGDLPKGLLHPKRIRDGVHQGVIDGGNQSGVPYGRGWELFDGRYLGKPLVFCGTVGALPVTIDGTPGEEKYPAPGDRIVMVGGRIGADGIHGATFSSAALDESAPVQAVQIGDPITQKRMFDFLIEARDLGLYRAITDNGAGGLSSSIGEMAETPGGARVDLANAPLKYAGLAPWEIFLSEAQERMTLAVSPARIAEFLDLARRREVEACDLGEFTDDGVLHITHGDEPVAFLDMEFLHEGDPDLDLTARWTPPRFEEPTVAPPDDLGAALVDVVGRLNLCSNERKARHYDHEVKGLTVVKPWVGVHQDVPAEATVFLARHGSLRGYVLSEGVHPFLSDLDTEAMARVSLDEAVRRQLCAGARIDRIAALDNFCWPDPVKSPGTPDGEYKLAQLVRACRGLHDLCLSYGTPLISGKDSMKNDSVMGGVKISVPPTLLVSAIGIIDDVRDAVTLDFKCEGDVVYVLGTTADEAGGSEWYRYLADLAGRPVEPGLPAPFVGTRPPRVDADRTVPLYRALHGAVRAGLVRSAATPGRGGLAVAIARAAMAGALGIDADLEGCDGVRGLRDDIALYGESAGRFVIGVAAGDADAFERRFEGLPCRRVGTVTDDRRVVLRRADRTVAACDVDRLRAAYRETLEHA